MSSSLLAALALALSYVCGSIPFGLLVARVRGVDIRQHGSGNIGATNVARNLGKGLGVLVLLLDALKGTLPMWGAMALRLDERVGPYVVTAIGWAAIGGHCFPVWLGFRGGKGVATSLGVLIVADPIATALAAVGFVLPVAAFRIVSLGSLLAISAFPAVAWLLDRPGPTVVLGLGAAVMVIRQHRENIARLWQGRENRF